MRRHPLKTKHAHPRGLSLVASKWDEDRDRILPSTQTQQGQVAPSDPYKASNMRHLQRICYQPRRQWERILHHVKPNLTISQRKNKIHTTWEGRPDLFWNPQSPLCDSNIVDDVFAGLLHTVEATGDI